MNIFLNIVNTVRAWMPWFRSPVDYLDHSKEYESLSGHEESNYSDVCKKCVPKVKESEGNDYGHSFDEADWKLSNLRKIIDITLRDLKYRDDNCDSSAVLPKKIIKALRNIGPYICTDEMKGDSKKVEFIGQHNFPAIAFVGLPNTKSEISGLLRSNNKPRFVFAIKADKRTLPFVEPAPGCHVYECGMAHVVNKKFLNNKKLDESLDVVDKKNDRLVWARWFSAVDKKTGEVKSLKVKRTHVNNILSKKPRRKGHHYPNLSVPSSSWEHMWHDVDRNAEELNGQALAWCLNSWITRDWHWNVVCKSKKNRITFSVRQNDAKRFFKDREIDIGGKRKPIFSMVKSHYRHNANGTISIVKGHHRGKTKFRWDEYDISIIAPGLNRKSLTEFTAEAKFSDDDRNDMIELHKATKRIAKAYES